MGFDDHCRGEKLYLYVVVKGWLGCISSLCQETFCLYYTGRRRNWVYMEDIHQLWFKRFSLEMTPPPWLLEWAAFQSRKGGSKQITEKKVSVTSALHVCLCFTFWSVSFSGTKWLNFNKFKSCRGSSYAASCLPTIFQASNFNIDRLAEAQIWYAAISIFYCFCAYKGTRMFPGSQG